MRYGFPEVEFVCFITKRNFGKMSQSFGEISFRQGHVLFRFGEILSTKWAK
jgi:hypothetical protein